MNETLLTISRRPVNLITNWVEGEGGIIPACSTLGTSIGTAVGYFLYFILFPLLALGGLLLMSTPKLTKLTLTQLRTLATWLGIQWKQRKLSQPELVTEVLEELLDTPADPVTPPKSTVPDYTEDDFIDPDYNTTIYNNETPDKKRASLDPDYIVQYDQLLVGTQQDLSNLFGITTNFSLNDLKKAYKQAMKTFHPDGSNPNPEYMRLAEQFYTDLKHHFFDYTGTQKEKLSNFYQGEFLTVTPKFPLSEDRVLLYNDEYYYVVNTPLGLRASEKPVYKIAKVRFSKQGSVTYGRGATLYLTESELNNAKLVTLENTYYEPETTLSL